MYMGKLQSDFCCANAYYPPNAVTYGLLLVRRRIDFNTVRAGTPSRSELIRQFDFRYPNNILQT